MGILAYLSTEVLKQIYNRRQGVKNPLRYINPLSNVLRYLTATELGDFFSSPIQPSKVASIHGKDRCCFFLKDGACN